MLRRCQRVRSTFGGRSLTFFLLYFDDTGISKGASTMGIPEGLPVAVIGAGPVGLAAAAHLIARELPVKVYEAGETVGAHVRDWGHVRLFSPWGYNVDQAAKALLVRHGWREP